MDFSALLSKEIAKKKAEAEAALKPSSTNSKTTSTTPKFLSKAELERNREKAYQQDQAVKQDKVRKRQLELELEKKNEEESKRKKPARLSSHDKLESQDSTSLSKSQVISRLRELREPITIFGETDKGRRNRLSKIEKKLELSKRLLKEQEEDSQTDPTILPQDIKDDQPKVYIQMRVYLKQLLQDWKSYLATHPDQSPTIYNETTKDIEILLDHLRNQTLHEQIFPSLATLLLHLQNKNFREANDTYIQLSIGNAAWPIGVIGVAIHERSAQSKITGIHNSSSNPSVQIAHIMSDDESRRWLTAVKRLITFSEHRKL